VTSPDVEACGIMAVPVAEGCELSLFELLGGSLVITLGEPAGLSIVTVRV